MSDIQNKFHTLLPQLVCDTHAIETDCKDRLNRYSLGSNNYSKFITPNSPPSPPLSANGSPQLIPQKLFTPQLFDTQNNYLPPSPPLQSSINITTTTTTTSSSQRRRRHVCKTCTMAFTTAGHLSRHNRIHTGEKNHTCPHIGCGQKFSRHDNCIQHYRTHLRKKSRK